MTKRRLLTFSIPLTILLLSSARGEPVHPGGVVTADVGAVTLKSHPSGEFSTLSLNASTTPLETPAGETWIGPQWSWTAKGNGGMSLIVDHATAGSPAATLRILRLPSFPSPMTVTATATWSSNRRRVSRSSSRTIGLKPKALPRLQYFQPSAIGGSFVEFPGTLYLLKGEELEFKAVSATDNAELPGGEIVWSGTAGATGTGPTKRISGNQVSRTMFDVQTVTATYGNVSITAGILVFELTPTSIPDDNFPGRDLDAYGSFELINLSCGIAPAGLAARDIGGLRWQITAGGGDMMAAKNGTGQYQCPGESAGIVLSVAIPNGPMQGRVRP